MTTSFEPPPTGPETGPPTTPPPVGPAMGPLAPPPMQPHRGPLILVLGILGLVICCICGIIAWVLGNNDLREIDAGRMDPAGRGMTNAGRICGIVSVVLAIVAGLVWSAIIVVTAFAQHFPH